MLVGNYYMVKLETLEGTKWFNKDERRFYLEGLASPGPECFLSLEDIRRYNLELAIWDKHSISFWKVETRTTKVNIPV